MNPCEIRSTGREEVDVVGRATGRRFAVDAEPVRSSRDDTHGQAMTAGRLDS